jgi:hypothetical protein
VNEISEDAEPTLGQVYWDTWSEGARKIPYSDLAVEYRELLSLYRPASGGWASRTSIGRLTRIAASAGVASPGFTASHGDVPDDLAAERDELRKLLDEIGVIAANAPEDGDSFGLLEQIAMRIAAAGVPDSTPVGEWPDPENPVTGRTPGAAAAPELAAVVRALDIARDEITGLRNLAADILGEFKASGDGHRARIGQVGYARWVQRAGLGTDR